LIEGDINIMEELKPLLERSSSRRIEILILCI